MRLGISSFTYPWAAGIPGQLPEHPLTAIRLLERAELLDVRVVQYGDNLPLHALAPGAVDALDRKARGSDIRIEVGTRGIGPHLSDYVALAARLGSPFVRLVVDQADDHPSPDEVVSRLAEWRSQFESAGLLLAIENHDRFPAETLAGIVGELGDWVGVCLDTVNSLGCLEPPAQVVEILGPLAVNLHLKDFVIRRHASQLGFEVVGAPAGSGMLDVGWLLQKVSGWERVESAILEAWVPAQATLEETVALESRWAAESVSWLRAHTALE